MFGMVVAQGPHWGCTFPRLNCSRQQDLALHIVKSSRAGTHERWHHAWAAWYTSWLLIKLMPSWSRLFFAFRCHYDYHQTAFCPHRICTDPRGRKYAQQVQCARVYHINVVLRIRTSTQDRVRDRPYKEKSMQIQRYACYLPHLCPYHHLNCDKMS